MQLALDLARRGRGFTSPNPMVGAVVVNNGKIVGRGYHPRTGEPHAEVFAIDDAGDKARGATIYVTLEPCNHTGRTPPCVQKIIAAGINRAVVAMEDPNPDVTGGGLTALRNAGLTVVIGVLEGEARRLNEVFVKYITTKLPFVLVKCAATLDGQLSTRTGDSKWVTGPAAREYVHQLRHEYDSILVGAETVRKDNPSLTARLEDRKTRDPIRIVLDTNLSVSRNAALFQQNNSAKTIVIAADTSSPEVRNNIESLGATVITLPPENGRISLNQLMKVLGNRGITSILIEGGGQVIHAAFQAGIVDKINFFYAPKIMIGNDGTSICSGTGPDLMQNAVKVNNIRVQCFGEDILMEGYPEKPQEIQ